MSTNKEKNLREVTELSDKIQKDLDICEGKVKEKSAGKSYLDNLPEEVDVNILDKLARYNSQFLSAATMAVAKTALPAFKDDINLSSMSGEVEMYENTLTTHVNRSRTTTPPPNPSNPSPTPVTTLGSVTTTFKTKGLSNAAYKQTRKEISELYESELK